MKLRLNTYTAYSIGCAVFWAIILAVVAAEASKDTKHTFIVTFIVTFLGWVIGWLSATIARAVYPPPKSRQPVNQAPCVLRMSTMVARSGIVRLVGDDRVVDNQL